MAGKSYYEITREQLGLSDANNEYNVKPVKAGVVQVSSSTNIVNKILDTDEKDNVVINYYKLTGDKYQYRGEKDTRWTQVFTRTRLKKPIITETGEEIKYLSPKGSGLFPYFPMQIIQKYLAKENIQTLIVTEGEKKAIKACFAGMDCIGIPSIHGFYAGDVKGRIHDDIQELIITCQVEKIIYLTDADTMVIKWEKGKDLYKRPASFYTAVKLFREGLQLLLDDPTINLKDVYFAYIQEKYVNEAKGLDDLLCVYPQAQEIYTDLLKFQFANTYFNCYIITDGKTDKIYKYFGLNSEKTFYEHYKKYIGNNEFTLKGRHYEYDGENVKYVRHGDADKYLRVGPDWLKVISVPNKHGETMEELIPYKVTEIKRDYAKYPYFLDEIPRYDAFFNEPCWNENYKRVLYNCYNLTNPMTHIPASGEWPLTYKFLKHVFAGNGEIRNGIECGYQSDVFTVAMDWLTIIFRYPKQMVPVPILVSKENRTGKSTFLKWMNEIYRGNTAILNNEQFKMKFNAHYITKYIIAIDEGFLDVDKKAEKERIKQLATSDSAMIENKGMNLKQFPYYGKLIICSNDADNVMKLEEHESRWFVVKVNPLPASEVDPELEEKMIAEIPAFLYYLKNREIIHPKKDRLWFKPDDFITDQFKEIVHNTRSSLEKEICEFIEDLFLTYRQSEMLIDLPWLHSAINKELKYKVNKTELKKFLKERKGLDPADKTTRCRIPYSFQEGLGDQTTPLFLKHLGRPYTFIYSEWVKGSSSIDYVLPKDEEIEEPETQVLQPSLFNEDQEKELPY